MSAALATCVRRVVLVAAALLLAACAGTGDAASPVAQDAGQAIPPSASSDAPVAEASGTVDFSCTTDAECTVKNVGNCCGQYPACVNVDSPTFPEQVKAQCAAEGMASICGFPSISSCQCVDNRCEGVGDGRAPALHRRRD